MYYASLLLAVCSVAFANPHPAVTLARRQRDFLTEAVTVTVGGTSASTFTHTIQAAIQTSDAGNTVTLSDGMVKAVQDMVADTALCPAKKEKEKRAPPTYQKNPLAPGPCFDARVNSMIDQMRVGGRFNGLILSVRYGAAIHTGLAGGIADRMQGFYNRAAAVSQLADWVPSEMLRNAVDLAAEIALLVEDNAQEVANFVWSHALLGGDPARSSRCLTDELAPLCADLQCWGDSNHKCTRDPLNGCPCLEISTVIGDGFDDTAWLDTQQDILNNLGVAPNTGPVHPACNGLNSKTWTSQKSVSAAADSFCHDSVQLTGGPGAVHFQEYNKGTADDVTLTIAFPTDMQGNYFSVSLDDCVKYFHVIIDACDGNDPNNVGNLKHGGAFPHPKGPIFSIDPKEGEGAKKCYGTGTKTWMDPGRLVRDTKDFCASNARKMKRDGGGGGHRATVDSGINQVFLELDYPAGATISPDDCFKNFDQINAGCDGGDSNNPLNFKHGGELIVGGAKYTISPLCDRTSPPLITSGWGWQDYPEVLSNGTTGLNNAPIDKGVMQDCLQNLRHGGWHGLTSPVFCGNLQWYLVRESYWKNSDGCWNACVNGLSKAINNGANYAHCYMKLKSATCWMAFYNKDPIKTGW